MANRYVAGTPEEQRALDAYIKLWRASQAAETTAHKHLTDHQLTISQFGVLEAIYHLGPLSQRQLAEKILRSSGNLTMVIDNLERGGLVVRQRAKLDRRVMIVNLTAEGEALVETILPGHVAGIREIFAVLTEEELDDLARISRKLGLALIERASEAQGAGRLRRARPVVVTE